MFFRVLVCLVFFCGKASLTAAQLLLFTFDGAEGDEAGFEASSMLANLEVGSMTRGDGLAASAAVGAFGARDWALGGLDSNDYFEFSVEPEFGYELGLTTLQLDERRSGSGIREWTVRSSIDGFSSDLSPGPMIVDDNTDTRLNQQVSFDAGAYSHLNEQVVFRIYGYQAETSVGTWRIDNVELLGSLTAVPEPSSLIISLAMGGISVFVCLWRKSEQGNEGSL